MPNDMTAETEIFPSPEPSHILVTRVRVASRLSLLTLGLGLALFLSDRLTGVPLDPDSLMTLALAAMGLVAWWLLKSGRFDLVAWLLVVWLFCMAAASSYFFGSVLTVNIALIPVGLVAVGLFFSQKALVGSTMAAVALLGGLIGADAAGWLSAKPSLDVGWRTWVSQAACLAGAAAMMYLNHTQTQLAQKSHLKEAQRRLAAMVSRDAGQERFARIFRSSPAPLMVQAVRTGLIIDVNAAFEQMTGLHRRQLVGQRDSSLWCADQRREQFSSDRRRMLNTGWHPLTLILQRGETIEVQVCCERDVDDLDGMAITAIRLAGAPLSGHGGQGQGSQGEHLD